MSTKPTLLALLVTALLTAAAWAIDPDATCTDEADSPKDRPGLQREELRFGYDLVDEPRVN